MVSFFCESVCYSNDANIVSDLGKTVNEISISNDKFAENFATGGQIWAGFVTGHDKCHKNF